MQKKQTQRQDQLINVRSTSAKTNAVIAHLPAAFHLGREHEHLHGSALTFAVVCLHFMVKQVEHRSTQCLDLHITNSVREISKLQF